MDGEQNTTSARVLVDALRAARDAAGSAGTAWTTRPALLVGELLERRGEARDAALADWLLAVAGPDAARRSALADVIGLAARRLAPDDEPPAEGAAVGAWRALVDAADRLAGSGAHPLGRPPFVSDALLDRLAEEARRQRPPIADARRTTAPAGDVLAALAVSRQLREAVEGALGFAVVPTYDALYEYDPPGSRVRTHVDAAGYPVVAHLLVEHAAPAGVPAESVLTAHLPGGGPPARLTLRPGEALVLRGRGTLHAWRALGEGERRTLVAVGFARQ